MINNDNQLGYSQALETNQVETPISSPSESMLENSINQQNSPYEYAILWIRLVAFLIDFIVVFVINYLIATVFNLFLPDSVTQKSFDSIISLVSNIITVIYFVYFCAKGQTIGKKIMKIKVISTLTNTAPGFLSAVIRELPGKTLSSFFGIGFLIAFKDPKKQTWYDKIAKTIVVKV